MVTALESLLVLPSEHSSELRHFHNLIEFDDLKG